MPAIIYFILIALLGLSIGSFLNVLILRYDDLKTIISVRSHCMHCKKEIRWYDLFPLLSYLFLRGRCRACGKKISWQYPAVEAATALAFVGIYFYFGISWGALILAIISSLYIVIAVYDIIHYELPDLLSYLAILLALGYTLLHLSEVGGLNGQNLLDYLYGVLATAGFIGLLVGISRQKWMGAGDIFLAASIGILLGYPVALVAMFGAFVLGSLFGIILIIFKRKGMKDVVPFGPFLAAGTFIGLFWGARLIDYYLYNFPLILWR